MGAGRYSPNPSLYFPYRAVTYETLTGDVVRYPLCRSGAVVSEDPGAGIGNRSWSYLVVTDVTKAVSKDKSTPCL